MRLTGAVGNDGFAEPALALLDAAGTDLSTVNHVSEPTGTALILVGGDGEDMIAVVPGANGTMTPEDATGAVNALSPNDTLMLQFEIPVAAVETALAAAKTKGVRTILNLAPLIPDAARLGLLADIVIANETEFERLAGRDNMSASDREAALARLHAETGQTLIVTLGGDGVIAIRNGELSRARASSSNRSILSAPATPSAVIWQPASTRVSISTQPSAAPPSPVRLPASSQARSHRSRLQARSRRVFETRHSWPLKLIKFLRFAIILLLLAARLSLAAAGTLPAAP